MNYKLFYILLLLIFSVNIVDAIASGTVTQVGVNQSNSTNFTIGQTINGSNITSQYFSYISAGNRNLSTSRCGINTSGLVLCMYMDETTGTLVQDYSGNGNNGTWHGNTTINSTVGKYNNALLLDGTDDYVSASTIPQSNITFSLWMKIPSAKNQGFINFVGGVGSNNYVGTTNAGTQAWIRLSDAYSQTFSSINIYNDNKYHFWVFYIEPNVLNNSLLSVDTINIGKSSFNSGSPDAWTGFDIGRSIVGYSNANVDELKIYNRSLSAEEIRQNYLNRADLLQAKTNSNSTYSSQCNASVNCNIPYTNNELESLLNFFLPSSQLIDGVTVYDYNVTSQFLPTLTITTQEGTTTIQDSIANGYQIVNVSYNSTNWHNQSWINFTVNNANADTYGIAVLANTTNRTFYDNYPSFNISQVNLTSNTTYYYNITKPYDILAVLSQPTNQTLTTNVANVAVSHSIVVTDNDYIIRNISWDIYNDGVIDGYGTSITYSTNITGAYTSKVYVNTSTTIPGWDNQSRTFVTTIVDTPQYSTLKSVCVQNITTFTSILSIFSLGVMILAFGFVFLQLRGAGQDIQVNPQAIITGILVGIVAFSLLIVGNYLVYAIISVTGC